MVAIIDYGLGNVGSIANMFKVVGEKSIITADRDKIASADRILLPGVGAFDAGMAKLSETGLVDFLKQQVLEDRKPILGICLGMQMLGRKSEEGTLPGLSLIPFDVVRFCMPEEYSDLKIPHMGWDIVDIKQEKNPLVDGLNGRQRFYFVHTYHAVCDQLENVLMTCNYGYDFACSVVKDNIYGTQFHPEKSHNFGMALLSNFVNKCK